MKKKGLKKYVGAGIVCLLTVMLASGNVRITTHAEPEETGSLAGKQANRMVVESMFQLAQNDSKVEQKKVSAEDQTVSETIAIVNQDEGTMVNGQNIVYSKVDSIYDPPKGDNVRYENTSLTQAVDGLSRGDYGAYIVIPKTFSETVASIDGNPKQCVFEYAVNRTPSSAVWFRNYRHVREFLDELRGNLSKYYLKEIFTEFYKAQDAAKTIMENDQKEKDIIDQLKATDFTALVDVPTLSLDKSNLASPNYSTYEKKNSEAVANLGNAYSESLKSADSTISELKTNASTLKAELEKSIEGVEGEKGIKDLEEETKDTLKELKESIKDEDNRVTNSNLEKIEKLQEKLDAFFYQLSVAIETSNRESKEKYDAQIEISLRNIIEEIIKDNTITSTQVAPDGKKIIIHLQPSEGDIVKIKDEITMRLKAAFEAIDMSENTSSSNIEANNELLRHIVSNVMIASDQTNTDRLENVPVTISVSGVYEYRGNGYGYEYEYEGDAYADDSVDTADYYQDTTVQSQEEAFEPIDHVDGYADVSYEKSPTYYEILDELDNDAYTRDLLAEAGYTSCREFMAAIADGTALLTPEEGGSVDDVDAALLAEEMADEIMDDVIEVVEEEYAEEVMVGVTPVPTPTPTLTPLDEMVKAIMDNLNSKWEDVNLYNYKVVQDPNNSGQEIEVVVRDDKGIPVSLITREIKTEVDTLIEELEKDIKGAKNNRAKELDTTFSEATITSVVDTINSAIAKITECKNSITNFENALADPIPTPDASKVNEYVEDLQGNLSDYNEAVNTSNSKYKEYADTTYAAAQANNQKMKKSLEDANAKAQSSLNDGVAKIKSIKKANSEENKKQLSDFANMLPTMGNDSYKKTDAYNLIADPIKEVDKSEGFQNDGEGDADDTGEDASSDEPDTVKSAIANLEEKNLQRRAWSFFGLGVSIIALFAFFVAVYRTQRVEKRGVQY